MTVETKLSMKFKPPQSNHNLKINLTIPDCIVIHPNNGQQNHNLSGLLKLTSSHPIQIQTIDLLLIGNSCNLSYEPHPLTDPKWKLKRNKSITRTTQNLIFLQKQFTYNDTFQSFQLPFNFTLPTSLPSSRHFGPNSVQYRVIANLTLMKSQPHRPDHLTEQSVEQSLIIMHELPTPSSQLSLLSVPPSPSPSPSPSLSSSPSPRFKWLSRWASRKGRPRPPSSLISATSSN